MPAPLKIKTWKHIDGEEWKPLHICSDYYISNMGRIKDKSNRLIVTNVKKGSYKSIKRKKIHRLVLECFDRKPKSGEIGRHLNGISTDNRLENLSWGTCSQNAKESFEHGRKIPNAKLNCDQVKFIRGCEYHRGLVKKLAKKFNVSISAINDVLTFRTWKTL